MLTIVVVALSTVIGLLLWALALSWDTEQQRIKWEAEFESARALYDAVNESRGLADVLDRNGHVIDRTYVRSNRD